MSILNFKHEQGLIQAQIINRARIILLKSEGISIDEIADKVGINRKSVMLCLKKFKEGGVENALFDAPGRGRNAEITNEEKTWIINIACQIDLSYRYLTFFEFVKYVLSYIYINLFTLKAVNVAEVSIY